MDYRFRRQATIVAILSFIVLLILGGVYYKWLYSPASCSDGKQNQKEEGIDCGGPCSFSCERWTIQDLQVDWTKAIKLKEGYYDLAAKISNPNPNFGLENFSYVFKIYDPTGLEIKQISGSSFVMPSRSKYIIEGNVPSDKEIYRVDLIINNPDKKEWRELAADYENPNIYVRDKQFKYLDGLAGAAEASGTVKNDSSFDFDQIVISIILYDENHNVIGVNKTDMRTVISGEERYFSTLWFMPVIGDVKSADMQAETNLFSDANFMLRFGAQEKFQEYQTSATPGY